MQPTTIAIDGGVFEHFGAYRGYLREYLDLLLGPEVRLQTPHQAKDRQKIGADCTNMLRCASIHVGCRDSWLDQ